jgi:hypothetical protein
MKAKNVLITILVTLLLLPGVLFAQAAAEETDSNTMRLAWWSGYGDKMNTQAATGSHPEQEKRLGSV